MQSKINLNKQCHYWTKENQINMDKIHTRPEHNSYESLRHFPQENDIQSLKFSLFPKLNFNACENVMEV